MALTYATVGVLKVCQLPLMWCGQQKNFEN